MNSKHLRGFRQYLQALIRRCVWRFSVHPFGNEGQEGELLLVNLFSVC